MNKKYYLVHFWAVCNNWGIAALRTNLDGCTEHPQLPLILLGVLHVQCLWGSGSEEVCTPINAWRTYALTPANVSRKATWKFPVLWWELWPLRSYYWFASINYLSLQGQELNRLVRINRIALIVFLIGLLICFF